MADSELFFKLANGDSFRRTLTEGEDESSALRNFLHGGDEWIEVDQSIYIHRPHIVSVQLRTPTEPMVAYN